MSKLLETLDRMSDCGVSFRIGERWRSNALEVDVDEVSREAAQRIRELEDRVDDLKSDLAEARAEARANAGFG